MKCLFCGKKLRANRQTIERHMNREEIERWKAAKPKFIEQQYQLESERQQMDYAEFANKVGKAARQFELAVLGPHRRFRYKREIDAIVCESVLDGSFGWRGHGKFCKLACAAEYGSKMASKK